MVDSPKARLTDGRTDEPRDKYAYAPSNSIPTLLDPYSITNRGAQEETCSECLDPFPPANCPGVWYEERRSETDGILYMILFAVIMLLLTLIVAIILSCIPRDDQPELLKSPANNQCVSLQSPPMPE